MSYFNEEDVQMCREATSEALINVAKTEYLSNVSAIHLMGFNAALSAVKDVIAAMPNDLSDDKSYEWIAKWICALIVAANEGDDNE